MSTCTLIESAANETYNPIPFENTGNLKFYHNNVPRFGSTNEVMHLLQGTADQDDYIQGLMASPIALVVFILFWIAVLCIFKCSYCCYHDHHWLTGTPTPLPAEPTPRHDNTGGEKEMDVDETTKELTAFKEKQGTETGVKLGQNRQGDLIVLRVGEEGFFSEDLKVGQRIMSIDGNPPEDDDSDGGTKGTGESLIYEDKVTEGMKTLRDSVGKIVLVVQSSVHKEDVKYAKWRNECDRFLRQKTIFKAIVAFCLLGLFIAGIVLCTVGANALESSIDTGVEALNIVEGRMRQGVKYLDDALRLNQLINNDVNSLLLSLNGICPARTNQICSNLNDPSSCQDIPGLSILSEIKQAISYTQDDTAHEQVIQDARSALDDIATQTASASADILDPVDHVLTGILAFGAIVIASSVLLGIVLFIHLPRPLKSALFFLSYGFLFIIILFSFLLLLALLPTSSVLGDVCYNDPGSRIETILLDNSDTTSNSDQIQDMVFNIFKGCSAPDEKLVETIDFQTEGFDTAIAQLKESAVVCGTPPSAITAVETTLNDGINVHLCETLNVLTEFSDFFTCKFWHPIYVQIAHESVCYEGMDAFSAITNTLFVILCMALLIMTFRVALWDVLSGSPLQEDSRTEEQIKGEYKTVEIEDPEDLLADTANVTPKKKKKKHASNTRALEEEIDGDEDEWNEGAPDVFLNEEAGSIGVDAESPKTKKHKTKKSSKKKEKKEKKKEKKTKSKKEEKKTKNKKEEKKTKKKSGPSEGETVEDPDEPVLKKRSKKKKKKKKEATGNLEDFVV